MSHCHKWKVTASLVFLSLKTSILTFTLRPLPTLLAQLLSLDPLITVNWWEFCLLLQCELPPEEGDPLEVSLSNCGVPFFYAIFYFYPHAGNEHSSAQSHDYSFAISHLCFGSIFLQALASTLWCCMLLWGPLCLHCSSGVPCLLALVLFPLWHLWWLNNLPVQCSPLFALEPLSQPN